MEWNQKEKPGNMNNWTELTKIVRLSDTVSETRIHENTAKREDGTLAGGRTGGQQWKQLSATNCDSHMHNSLHFQGLSAAVCLFTHPQAHSPPFRSRTFHTHIAGRSTTFSLSCWTLPSLRRQDAGCQCRRPVSVPRHAVRVFRWTEWHWDRFLPGQCHSANAPYSLYNSSSCQGVK
jgi:hypothetical protein